MKPNLTYPTLVLIIIVVALIMVKPTFKASTEAGLVNPITARQIININEVNESLTLINSTLGNLTKAKLVSIIGFINASRAAYSNGQAPPLNTKALSALINLTVIPRLRAAAEYATAMVTRLSPWGVGDVEEVKEYARGPG